MPLPSLPRTRLSRVAPHDACFITSVSGTPYLAKMPFSLATKSGAASVSAMKPSFAPFTSGPAACAKAPDGNAVRTADSSAAVAATAEADFTIVRRLMPAVSNVELFFLLIVLLAFCPWSGPPAAACVSGQNKKRHLIRRAFQASHPDERRCSGPPLGRRGWRQRHPVA